MVPGSSKVDAAVEGQGPKRRRQTPVTVPKSLKRAWWTSSLLGGVGLGLGWALIARAVVPPAGWTWFLLSAAVWLYLSTFTLRRLERNRREGEARILGEWGPGTWLSLLRALFISALAGFLLQGRPPGWLAWLPMALYTVSDVADYFDGYFARRSGRVTRLGIDLDLELDALGLLVAVLLAVRYGTLSPVFLPVGFARYAFALLIVLRRRLGRPVFELPTSGLRRPIAGLTMGFVSATLWPIVDSPEANLAAVVFLLPFGLSFLRDGLVVAGAVDPHSATYRSVRETLRAGLFDVLPLLLRPVLAAAVVLEIQRLIGHQDVAVQGLMSWGLNHPETVLMAFALLEAIGALALLLGWAGRLAAFALVFPIGLTITASALDPLRGVLLAVNLILLLTGTGRLSLWHPEAEWFGRPAGQKRAPN